jgi:hypothetical protein
MRKKLKKDDFVKVIAPDTEKIKDWEGGKGAFMYSTIGYSGKIVFLDDESVQLDNGWWYPNFSVEKIENEKETKITWDDVFKEFRTTKNLGDFEISYNDWLKENYVVPKKIK